MPNMTKATSQASPWMTRHEAMAYLGVSSATFDRIVRRRAEDGRDLRHYAEISARPRFHRDELDEVRQIRRRE